jgi:hypothetical protein
MSSPKLTQAQHDAFEEMLSDVVPKYGARSIVEENNPEALSEKHLQESSVQRVARKLGVGHAFCDPDNVTRARLGIRQEGDIRVAYFSRPEPPDEAVIQAELAASYRARERYWLERLKEHDGWPAIVVCGANHVEPFRKLLKSKGFRAEVVFSDWEAA